MMPTLKVRAHTTSHLPLNPNSCRLYKHLGIGCIPWSPLARGYLSRPWPTGDDAANKTTREETDRFSGLYKNMSPEITQQ